MLLQFRESCSIPHPHPRATKYRERLTMTEWKMIKLEVLFFFAPLFNLSIHLSFTHSHTRTFTYTLSHALTRTYTHTFPPSILMTHTLTRTYTHTFPPSILMNKSQAHFILDFFSSLKKRKMIKILNKQAIEKRWLIEPKRITQLILKRFFVREETFFFFSFWEKKNDQKCFSVLAGCVLCHCSMHLWQSSFQNGS